MQTKPAACGKRLLALVLAEFLQNREYPEL